MKEHEKKCREEFGDEIVDKWKIEYEERKLFGYKLIQDLKIEEALDFESTGAFCFKCEKGYAVCDCQKGAKEKIEIIRRLKNEIENYKFYLNFVEKSKIEKWDDNKNNTLKSLLKGQEDIITNLQNKL